MFLVFYRSCLAVKCINHLWTLGSSSFKSRERMIWGVFSCFSPFLSEKLAKNFNNKYQNFKAHTRHSVHISRHTPVVKLFQMTWTLVILWHWPTRGMVLYKDILFWFFIFMRQAFCLWMFGQVCIWKLWNGVNVLTKISPYIFWTVFVFLFKTGIVCKCNAIYIVPIIRCVGVHGLRIDFYLTDIFDLCIQGKYSYCMCLYLGQAPLWWHQCWLCDLHFATRMTPFGVCCSTNTTCLSCPFSKYW